MGDVAYSYLRFSSPKQEKGDSVRRQTSLRDGWLERTKIPLDESLTFADKGVSGYSTPADDREGLQAFLSAVQSGRVRPGSYLIIENLDRLTREDIKKALALFLNLLTSGIRIVQLSPEIVFDENADEMQIVIAIMELRRGHSESKMKSLRLGEIWKKKKAGAGEELVTLQMPGWLRYDEDTNKIVAVAERAEVVKKIFRLAISGMGVPSICKELNKQTPNWGKRSGGKWSVATVHSILTSRSVLGEYQPHNGHKKRTKSGPPVVGYYPAIISEDDFNIAQASMSQRKINGGGRKSTHVNLFSGLMFDARDGGPIIAERATVRRSCYSTKNAKHGLPGAVWSSFPMHGFDLCLLLALKEVQAKHVYDSATADNKADAWSAELSIVRKNLAEMEAKALTSELSPRMLSMMEKLEEREQELAELISAESRKPRCAADDLKRLNELALGSNADRAALANLTHKVIKEIRCLFIGGKGQNRAAAVEVRFNGSAAVRCYVIFYKPHRAGHNRQEEPEEWSYTSAKSDGNGIGLLSRWREVDAEIREALRRGEKGEIEVVL